MHSRRRHLAEDLFFSLIVTMFIGGFAWGSIWSTGWNGAAPAVILIFTSIWLGVMWLLWFVA